ncbi:MAG: bacteriophage holin [Calditrichia bacterium]
MKLNPKALALTSGILWGLAVFVATIWLLIIGSTGNTISLLDNFYFGYSFSVGGAFIGLLWGFVDGLICGYLFALIYNLFLPKQS